MKQDIYPDLSLWGLVLRNCGECLCESIWNQLKSWDQTCMSGKPTWLVKTLSSLPNVIRNITTYFLHKKQTEPSAKKKKRPILPVRVHVVEKQQHCSITDNPQTCEGCAYDPIDVGDEICQLLDLRKTQKKRLHNLTTRLGASQPGFYMRHKKNESCFRVLWSFFKNKSDPPCSRSLQT